ncbi:MAG: MotA/TolQ/ExbB proton channel family protein [Planctomycetota bacterium]
MRCICPGNGRRGVTGIGTVALLLAVLTSASQAQSGNWGGVQPLARPQVQNLAPTSSQPTYYQGAPTQAPNPNYGVRTNTDPRIAGLPSTGNAGTPISSAKPETPGIADPNSAEGKIPVRSLLQMFHDGGWMMYPIALCSFALMVYSFERFIFLRRGRVIPLPFVNRLIEQLQQQQMDREEALELCERHPSPMAKIMYAAVKKYGRASVEVEQAVLDSGERESNHLRRNLRILSGISNVSPLLGLLGTVLGMIQSFNDISSSQAMGRPEMLAGGISQALLTTAAGLLVAIPAYVLYIYFVGHIDRLIMEMDVHAQRLIDVISAEGLQESDVARSPKRSRKAA